MHGFPQRPWHMTQARQPLYMLPLVSSSPMKRASSVQTEAGITKSWIVKDTYLFHLQRGIRTEQELTLKRQIFSPICSWAILTKHTEQAHITAICKLDSTKYTALCSALWKLQSLLDFCSKVILSFIKVRTNQRKWTFLPSSRSALKWTRYSNFSNTVKSQLNNLSLSDSIGDSWIELNCNRECLGFSN